MKKFKLPLILLAVIISASTFSSTKNLKKKNEKSNRITECTLEDVATAGLGDVKYSLLSLSKFQQANGRGWVLMQGQNKAALGITTESSVFDYYDSSNELVDTLPDARGLFFRGKNNGRSADSWQDPGGERLLGSKQVDDFKSHTHSYVHRSAGPNRSDGTVDWASLGNGTTGATGGDETRPRNIAVNIFVKVKRNCLDSVAMNLVAQNTAAITALQNYNNTNQCDACLNLPEGNLANLQAKLACFKEEIDLYEGDQKNWSVTCTARTVSYAKKVLMLIGVDRDSDDNLWLSHLDNQYPYYNVFSVN